MEVPGHHPLFPIQDVAVEVLAIVQINDSREPGLAEHLGLGEGVLEVQQNLEVEMIGLALELVLGVGGLVVELSHLGGLILFLVFVH
jgi:hypothetical protein